MPDYCDTMNYEEMKKEQLIRILRRRDNHIKRLQNLLDKNADEYTKLKDAINDFHEAAQTL